MRIYEADDIIGTIAQQASSHQIATDIYSSDQDFLQLINDYITIRLIKKGVTTISNFDIELLNRKYQLKPEQIVDFKSMVGDNSDNIVGIPGIGPKTALKLLHQFNNLDNLLINLKEIPDNLRTKIESFKDRIHFNRLLITIDKTVPLSFDYTQTYKDFFWFKKTKYTFVRFYKFLIYFINFLILCIVFINKNIFITIAIIIEIKFNFFS
ncbi:5'-3' exonuclease H3TH domain-containing protein [Candidatus Phytoplasma australasiaticum]